LRLRDVDIMLDFTTIRAMLVLMDEAPSNDAASTQGTPPPMNPVDEAKTCVIVALDAHCERNLLLDFLPTLRGAAAYRGQVHVIDYGMSGPAREQVAALADRVIPIERAGHVVVQRFRDAARVISELPAGLTHVLMIDCGDVWFQAPFVELWGAVGDGVGFVEEDLIEESTTMQRWLRELPDRLRAPWRQALRGTRTVNMGMNAGAREAMAWFYEEISRVAADCGPSRFGLDQLVACHVIRSAAGRCRFTPLDSKFNFILLGHMEDLRLRDGVFLDKHGAVPAIVHNLGGSSRPIKAPWAVAQGDPKVMAHFMIECLFRRVLRHGPRADDLRQGFHWLACAPSVAIKQLARLVALRVLPRRVVQAIVDRRQRHAAPGAADGKPETSKSA
jgi:hypothetical protein